MSKKVTYVSFFLFFPFFYIPPLSKKKKKNIPRITALGVEITKICMEMNASN